MTAIWEQALDEIEAGRLTLDAFVAKQASWIAQLIEHCGTLTWRCLSSRSDVPHLQQHDAQRKGKSGPFWSCPVPGMQGDFAPQ
jgi:DNA topoisomerase-3